MAAESAASVRFATNFQRNLDQLEAFENERGSPGAFASLLDELFATIIPALERFPRVGRDLLGRTPGSVEAVDLQGRILSLLPDGASVRVYSTTRHAVLYLEQTGEVVLLAIKHHRQLSFDFQSFWDWED